MVPKTFPFPPTEGGYVLKRLNPSDAHRHQHIEGRAAVVFADQGRGGGVGQVQFHQVAVDLAKNVQQIAGVEADVETLALEGAGDFLRSEEHTSELQSLMRLSYAVFCLK